MKIFEWNSEKNSLLKEKRNISFEEIVVAINNNFLLDVIDNPNIEKYPNQKIYIINHNDYVYLVPFVEEEKRIFLKTIIPSRKAKKQFLEEKNEL